MNSPLRSNVATLSVFLLVLALAVACADASPTAVPQPTHTPYPPSTTSVADSTPPSQVMETREEELFSGRAWVAVKEGLRLHDAGDYEAAVERLQEALEYHGKPSYVLENRIALAYEALGMYDQAIKHYSNSIAINNSPVGRVNRALLYLDTGRCDLAIEDAKIALTLEPKSGPGYHTDADAHTVLYLCYFIDGNMTAALQHVDAALLLAKEHSYPPGEIAQMSETRDRILGN